MNVYEIAQKIEEFAPRSLAYDWDNPGILIGDGNKEVKKALITLDVNLFTVNEAVNEGADMIISHHPMFFKGIKRIDFSTETGKIIKLLIKNDIAVFAAHTNMDIAKGGINDKLAKIFELENTEILEFTDESNGLGRVGYLKNEISFTDFCDEVSKKLNTKLRVSGDFHRKIKKVAVASGSCSEVIPSAIAKNCDVIITGDMKYHEMMDNTAKGINIIDAGHYPTEICVIDIFRDILKDCNIETVRSQNTDVFKYFG